MDIISGLPDGLLVKILSFLPSEVAISTSILSKRWECLWRWLSKLEFVTRRCTLSECERLQCFLDRNLPLHRAPVIKSFRLDLVHSYFKREDIKLWILNAVSHYVREMEISYCASPEIQNILPSNLYTCKSLVSLRLSGQILLDVPHTVCLSSLKSLNLEVEGLNGESVRRFLSVCPVLEDLLVDLFECPKIGKITIIVPSLQYLSLLIPYEGEVDELVINTPSLKYFNFEDPTDKSYSCLIRNMPKLEEAHVNVKFAHIESLIGSITSVKQLTICSKAVYGGGLVFNQLEHLKLCRGKYSPYLLNQLLKDSPNLRVLHLNEMEDHVHGLDGLVSWSQPSNVPTCMLSNLQTFNWSDYCGRPLERDIAVYILKNARCLKTATISSNERFVPKLEMIKELSLSSRASNSCQLVFD